MTSSVPCVHMYRFMHPIIVGSILHTGRGGKGSVSFTYTVSKSGRGGQHYEGEDIPGWGNEIWITTASGKRDRSISRSTVELGFRKYLEKDITGPRQLGVFGASYLLPLFQRFV